MEPWIIILLIVLANWLLPLVFSWSYILLAYCLGDVVYAGMYGPFAKFRLAYKGLQKWHDRLWRDWGGVGLFLAMVYRDNEGPEDDAWVARTVVHEGTHCWHWVWLGAMFYVTYLGHMLFIFLFQKERHPYLDCWSERLARKRAGQLVDVPRDQWPDGPKDRWPWW